MKRNETKFDWLPAMGPIGERWKGDVTRKRRRLAEPQWRIASTPFALPGVSFWVSFWLSFRVTFQVSFWWFFRVYLRVSFRCWRVGDVTDVSMNEIDRTLNRITVESNQVCGVSVAFLCLWRPRWRARHMAAARPDCGPIQLTKPFRSLPERGQSSFRRLPLDAGEVFLLQPIVFFLSLSLSLSLSSSRRRILWILSFDGPFFLKKKTKR